MLQIDPKLFRTWAILTNAFLTKSGLIAGGYFLGRWLDRKFGTDPYLMASGIVLGFALGLWWILRVAKKFGLL